MKVDMRLFGPRTRLALKTDLKSRLEEKRRSHEVEVVLKELLEGLDDYKTAIFKNFAEYTSDTKNFKSEKNLTAFWMLMNSFLLELVERPEKVDAVILEKPVQDILSPYFEEIGYLLDFYIHSLFSDWFPYYTVTVARLYSRQQMNETMFGYPLNYTLEHIRSLKQSIIFGVSSFFDPRRKKIRIDHSIAEYGIHGSLRSLEKEESDFVESVTQKPYKEAILEHVLFHEKAHYLFHMIKQEKYSGQYNDADGAFNILMLSEAWARLVTLYLSNGALMYEINSLLELKNSGDPVYYATHAFLSRFTPVFELFENIDTPLDEMIVRCRTLALKSLIQVAGWMDSNFKSRSEKNWHQMTELMRQAYDHDASACSHLDIKYRPPLNIR